jgi:hypothetical protein
LLNLHKQENDTDFSIRFKTIRLSKNKTKAGARSKAVIVPVAVKSKYVAALVAGLKLLVYWLFGP